MSWASARGLLAKSVVTHLGEALTLSEAPPGTATASVRGVLTFPESIARFGASQVVAGDARLTLRKLDAPAWLERGARVLMASGEAFDVVTVADNSETMLEVTLCRS